MTRLTLAALALILAAGPLTAQEPAPRSSSPALIKYGKWATLGASIAMNILAARAHSDADDAFDVITRTCVPDPTRCDTGPNGRYLDPFIEGKYQRSLSRDRAARGWLIGGETLLVGTAAMFIWELTRSRTRPANIPFEPQVTTRGDRTEVGVRFAF